MRGIGIILIIIFAVASILNKRAAQVRQAARKPGPAAGKKQEPKGLFRQAMRQFEEAMEKAAGTEPGKKPAPAQNNAAPPAPETEAFDRWEEPDFRGSMAAKETAFDRGEGRPRAAAPQIQGREPKRLPADEAPGGILPRMQANSLVQAVVTHEILTRPRSAWRPRREHPGKAAPGA